MDLYIDGNIAQMYSPEGAMRYFSRLLGVDARPLRPTVTQERPHPFLITNSTGRPLDYAITQAGTIVPQRMWSSGSPSDARRQANVLLNMPVFFVNSDHVTLGFPLLSAITGDRSALLGANDAAPLGNCSTLYIRITVCDYSFTLSWVFV
jgi:hypothetical protein